jgi:hypothetical protein
VARGAGGKEVSVHADIFFVCAELKHDFPKQATKLWGAAVPPGCFSCLQRNDGSHGVPLMALD